MSITLQLSFLTELGNTVTLSIPDPKPGLTEAEVQQVMQTIIDKNVFTSTTGPLVAIKAARVVAREVTPLFPAE
ncbi:MAG: DUF2922 domain-containing protein [Firmicutes bacterium]|nr:DUF2922 domain-containing protein [Bacillota bacterium]